jgi:outer membrane protein
MVRLHFRGNSSKLGERKRPMNLRYLRTILTMALIAATAIAPVAPAFAQAPDTPAPTQVPTPPPNSPPTQVKAPGQPAAPSTTGAPAAETPAAPQPAPPPAPIPDRTYTESRPDYEHGRRAFPNLIGPYMAPSVDQPKLTNSQQLVQMIQDGKIQLSLQDCIALALENNMDIEIQRYNPWIAETNVLRAKGGGQGFALGNLAALSFDPVVGATATISDINTPVSNPFLTGAGIGLTSFSSHNTTLDFNYAQGFATGTSLYIALNNTRESSTSGENTFNPFVESTLQVAFTQQLLNGFGIGVNRRNITITKIDKQIADSAFEQQIITSITAVENAYWELVYARDNIKVGQESLTLAQQTYDDNKKQVDIGTLAPLELVQAEAQVAQAQQTLITDQTVQLQNQTTLLNLIVKDVTDPALLSVEIVPTDELTPSTDQPMPDLAQSLKEALANRPDVQQAGLTIKVDDVNVKSTRNALLPTLSVGGQYESVGLAGNSTTTTDTTTALGPDLAVPIYNANGTPYINPVTDLPVYVSEPTAVTTSTSTKTSGIGDAYTETFHNRFPDYSAQFTLSIPIRNREAQADSAHAQLSERQDEANQRKTENGVLVDVRNAIIELVQGKAALDAATKTRILDQETLDDEEKKLKLGASTIFNVVVDQNTLAGAASAEVRALANLVEAQVNYDRAMARTLNVNHITIADAKTGVVGRDTLIPGTMASGALVGDATAVPNASASDSSDEAGSGASVDTDQTRASDATEQRDQVSRGN